MKTLDAAARTFSLAVLKTDDNRRAIIEIDKARRDDADHARMPVFPDDDKGTRRSRIDGSKLFFRLLQYVGFDLLPLGIQFVQQQRDVFRFVLVLGQQQLDAAHRGFKATGSVQPRRKHEADLTARYILPAKPRDLNELPQPLELRFLHA